MLMLTLSLDHSTSLELTSAGEFLKLIQQSDCVWVQPDINWTPDLFIGRRNGNCKKKIVGCYLDTEQNISFQMSPN